MDFHIKYITPDIKLSTYEDKLFKTENVFEFHMLVWFISGETKIIQADKSYVFKAGDIFLIPRNHLATIINYPKNGSPHKAVVMHLTKERLKEYYSNIEIKQKKLSGESKIYSFTQHPLLESCLASLIPYFDIKETFPDHIASLKITEAISILREIDESVDNLLADFEEPGKIDLVHFMEKNYMFNMPLERFGYLTGRSLSTFNRDFRKVFETTPQRWLTQKRLQLAYYHLTEKHKKPSDVFLEVGFEDLSHFSYAFKKQYGFSPSIAR
ncbi:helix-turn-helix domain-containing protein [Chryseobacterium potabilaquae]|uniref:Exoenzyme S synthesis regulatory protein ExsA n=1 Tax=Chryseobacterium potabilaquae TaxID=2675057 RepID=A0A6N4X3E4_9FLAO|nr:AraC family transcriptional regulator [Chryseobacterium potabilaquae]CAA7193696.1 Exoenzyme S synthesis regulatory protein ExsA [Chryseobacterium potabilaquae]